MAALVESECTTAALVVQSLTPSCRSPGDINNRLDRLIRSIREKWHACALNQPLGSPEVRRGDVLIVAHGHILRAFAQRWTGSTLHEGPLFLLEAGGVGTLR